MFIGENLANLRIMRGFSRKQLSELLNVTEQAVWQYENNYTTPKMGIINELKRIFNIKSKYFYTKDFLVRNTAVQHIKAVNIAYRSKTQNSTSKTQTEAKHIAFLDVFVDHLTMNISYPSLKIIQLRDQVIEYLNSTEDSRNVQIETVAHLARQQLGMRSDTNEDLMFLVEKSGVFIFEKSIGEEIDAYSLWTENERPYIMLGNMKRSAVRRNFDIAHELGHLLLHYRLEFGCLDRQEHKIIENEANQFAGAFLLPEETFKKDMRIIERPTNPDAYIDLKQKWQTSLQVLGYRAVNLGLLKPKEHRNFYASMHRKGYLKQEPLDAVIPIQKPKKVKSIIDFIVNKKLLDFRDMIDNVWKVELPFLYNLTGIETDFFGRYLQHNQDFELGNVVAFHQTGSSLVN